MSLQKPAPTPVQKASRTRRRQKFSAAKAFYLTVLVISAIAILSLFKDRRIQHDINGGNLALFSRTHLANKNGLSQSDGELGRRDQAVRWLSLGTIPGKSSTKLTMLNAVPTRQCRQGPMRFRPRQLPR